MTGDWMVRPRPESEGMKKFLMLPVILAIGFGILMLIDSEPAKKPSTDEDEAEMVTLPSGLKYRILKEGEGRETKAGDSVVVHYTGKLTNGVVFDSSHNRGDPFTFVLGAGRVIKGWDEGVVGMKVGEKRKLVIPPELGYGSRGSPPSIPPNAKLIFEVEVVDIK